MTIDIIIPNYNSSRLVQKNISSVLRALEGYRSKVIIVDDGSNSEEIELLETIVAKHAADGVELVKHPRNKGFSSAVNTGVRASEAEYVVLLNSDVVPRKDFLAPLIQEITHDPLIFGIGCTDESVEGTKKVLRGRGIARWSKGLLVHQRGEVDKTDTFWISGGSSIFRRELYNKFNGMDEILNPFYWEDIDLSYRARKSGYKVLFNRDSIVEHAHDEGSIKKNFKKNKVTTVVYRNQFIFLWKNITDPSFIVSHIIYLPYHAAGALKRGDMEFFKGFFLALIRLPAIIQKRNIQKKLYKLSDAEVIGNIT